MSSSANLFVITAPSGAGKTTLVQALVKRNRKLRFSVSYTTRERRKNEVEGLDYLFVDEAAFEHLEAQNKLLESARVFDNLYGSSRAQVEQYLAAGQQVILEIDWQGAQQVRESMPSCVSIFILPPSSRELERRLRSRQTDSAAVIKRRLSDALGDMSHWSEFDFAIINDDLHQAVAQLEAVLAGDGHASKVSNPELSAKIQKILV